VTFENEILISEIVQLVAQEIKYPNIPFRPKVDSLDFEDINNLMIKCWSEDPDLRPDFAMLKQTIRKINK
jgi:atrial natriuretic peptide receptor A